jgi:hypothetical protein
LNLCLGPANGKVKLSRSHAIGGDSRSSLVANQTAYWQVESITLETLFQQQQIHDCNFIKMDIEGGEVFVLPAIASFLHKVKPTLYLSLHPLFFPEPEKNKKILLEILLEFPIILDKLGNPLTKKQLETWNYDCVIAMFEKLELS